MSTVNLAVLAGTLVKAAEPRLLPDGSTIWELEISIRPEGRAASTVPVSWAPANVDPAAWAPGEPLVVVGAVRRRFYRAGGATVSRTDVLAESIVPARQRKRLLPLLTETLGPLCSVEAPVATRRGDKIRDHG